MNNTNGIFKTLVENSDNIISLLDESMVFQYVSPSIKYILGYSPSEVLHKTPSEVFGSPPDYDIRKPKKKLVTVEHKLHKGRKVTLEIVMNPLLDRKGKVETIISTGREVTEWHALVTRLEREATGEKEQKRINSMVTEMFMHELRNPLATVMSSLEIMNTICKEPDLGGSREKVLMHLDRATRNVRHLHTMVNSGYFSGKDVGKKHQAIPVKHFLLEMVSDFRAVYGEKAIGLSIPANERTIISDPFGLNFIFRNLIENALKYSGKSKQEPHIALYFHDRHVAFVIRDRGIGIPHQDQKHIFDLAYRGRNVDHIPGGGFGLSVVRELLHRLGGDIDFSSRESIGSEFTVTLPYGE